MSEQWLSAEEHFRLREQVPKAPQKEKWPVWSKSTEKWLYRPEDGRLVKPSQELGLHLNVEASEGL